MFSVNRSAAKPQELARKRLRTRATLAKDAGPGRNKGCCVSSPPRLLSSVPPSSVVTEQEVATGCEVKGKPLVRLLGEHGLNPRQCLCRLSAAKPCAR